MDTARLFRNGQSQAVRLPKEFRFNGEQVWIKRIGNAVVLLPYDEPWQVLIDSLEKFSDDFMAEREQPLQQQRGDASLMNYMLNINICVALIRYRSVSLLQRITSYEPGMLGVSSITISELFHGAEKSARPQENRAALEQFLLPLVVVAYDEAASHIYGWLRTDLERAGMLIGSMDMLIAAHALSLEVTLVTNNTREFQRVTGLVLEDWLSS